MSLPIEGGAAGARAPVCWARVQPVTSKYKPNWFKTVRAMQERLWNGHTFEAGRLGLETGSMPRFYPGSGFPELYATTLGDGAAEGASSRNARRPWLFLSRSVLS